MIAEVIKDKLTQALAPTVLTIEDDSAAHAGHKGNRGGGHFSVIVVSACFSGLSPVQRHKLVYQALAEEMKGPIHALAIDARTPEEDAGGKA